MFARQIGTYLLFRLDDNDFMSRLASRLAFSFSFGLKKAMGGYMKYPEVPGAGDVMAKFFGNLGVLVKFLKNLKGS